LPVRGRLANGISFPFRFGGRGGVVASSARMNELDAATQHISESIYQIVATEPGERINEPEFGTRLRDVIFEPLDWTVISIIRNRILTSIRRWEKRVNIYEYDVTVTREGDKVMILLSYTIIDYGVGSMTTIEYNIK
jgi:phage baseplate assembly protein W